MTQAPHRRQRAGAAGASTSARRPRRPAGRGKLVAQAPPSTNDKLPILPAISSTAIHQAPADLDIEPPSRYFANKVVLCFEVEFTETAAKSWIESYNLRNDLHLTIVDTLHRALFVAQFDVENLAAAKERLLAASPILGTKDVFAAVNDYTDHFEPCKQLDFKHLVTVYIHQGSREILHYIKFIASLIGTYVKAEPDKGTSFQRITLVVESTLKILPARGLFKLQGPEVTTVAFNYVGKNLRCYFCFSYRHLPHQCKRPRPAFYNEAALDQGSAPSSGAAPTGHTRTDLSRRAAQAIGKRPAVKSAGNSSRQQAAPTHVAEGTIPTQEQTRPQERVISPLLVREEPNTLRGLAGSHTVNTLRPRTTSPSPLVANHSSGAVQRKSAGAGSRSGQMWVAKQTNTTPAATIPAPAAVGTTGNASTSYTVHPIVDLPSPALVVEDAALITPLQSPTPLALVPFQVDNGMGSSRKRLRLDPITPAFNLNLSSDSQIEPPRPTKRSFKTGYNIPTRSIAEHSNTLSQDNSETVIRDSLGSPFGHSTPVRISPFCAPWDLVPATLARNHEETDDAHLQYAWIGLPAAEDERSPFTEEPAGSA